VFLSLTYINIMLCTNTQVDPNDPEQCTRSSAPVVISKGGCCSSAVISPGVPGGQTPLMCAAKGASEGSIQVSQSLNSIYQWAFCKFGTSMVIVLDVSLLGLLLCSFGVTWRPDTSHELDFLRLGKSLEYFWLPLDCNIL